MIERSWPERAGQEELEAEGFELEVDEALDDAFPASEENGTAAAEAAPVVDDEPAEEAAADDSPVLGGVPEHAQGELEIPDGVFVVEGEPRGGRRGVGLVVARFNADITNRLLAAALDELDRCGVAPEAVTVMPVPGAFELPLGAMALAKSRRYSCIVALGCVIRGETPHFDFIASEAASGLQLAGLETGVPVAFGVLTVENAEQAEARVAKGAEAVRTALEMADAFSQLRAAAAESR